MFPDEAYSGSNSGDSPLVARVVRLHRLLHYKIRLTAMEAKPSQPLNTAQQDSIPARSKCRALLLVYPAVGLCKWRQGRPVFEVAVTGVCNAVKQGRESVTEEPGNRRQRDENGAPFAVSWWATPTVHHLESCIERPSAAGRCRGVPLCQHGMFSVRACRPPVLATRLVGIRVAFATSNSG